MPPSLTMTSPTLWVRTPQQLKQLVADYLERDSFAIDVETNAGRLDRLADDGRCLSRLPATRTRKDGTGRAYGEWARRCERLPEHDGKHRHANGQEWTDEDVRQRLAELRRLNIPFRQQAATKDKPTLDSHTNAIWCVSLATQGRSDVIPCGHPRGPDDQLMRSQVFEALEPLLFSDRVKINQNIKFDLLSMAKYYGGRIPPPPYLDTLVAAFLLNENLPSYRLGDLSSRYLGFIYNEKLGEEAYFVSFERAIRYSVIDSKMGWLLWYVMAPLFTDRPELMSLLHLEMDVLAVLMDMHHHGAHVDRSQFPDLRKDFEAKRRAAQQATWAEMGEEINLDSPIQLGRYFYDDLKLPCLRRTEKGGRSVDRQALVVLATKSKAARRLLEYKDFQKFLSTYIDGFLPHVDDHGRVRANFNQASAKTGRLSCSQPNLQNIPARHKQAYESTRVRQLFTAPAGYKLIVADYSQIELRILAHLSQDELLVRAYQEEIDVHAMTASLIFNVDLELVTKEQRSIGKNSNFAFAFEGGPVRVQEMAGIGIRQATKVYNAWHIAYPGVQKWGRQVKRDCYRYGYVVTAYGRKRRLPEITEDNGKLRSYAERQAVNHPIQGLAADIAKIALVQIHRALGPYDAHLTLQIHDEFVIECAEAQVEAVVPLVRNAMEDVRLDGEPVLSVPLVADIHYGDNWAETKG